MKPVIQVTNLKKTYKGHERGEGFKEAVKSIFKRKYVYTHALKGINFSISRGDLVGFVGQNGAGKSTTIKILTSVLFPSEGKVDVLGFEPWSQRKKYVAHIGAVFGQKSQLWWDLPPLDSFYLSKGIYDIPEKEFKQRLHHMIQLLRVEKVVSRPTRELSLGERMKCEFIMAFLHNPEILFLDEPTIGVDALAKEDIRYFLKEINKTYKTTIILTTHDMDDIEEVCERIIIIDEGALLYDGDLKKVKSKYVRWKTVSVDFSGIRNKALLEKVKEKAIVQEERPTFLSLRFEKDKVAVPNEVARLMLALDVTDLVVHEPRLEHVIKEIYRDKGFGK